MTGNIIKKFISIAETYNKEENVKSQDKIVETLREQTSVCMIDKDTDIIIKIASVPKDNSCKEYIITEAVYSDTMQEFITIEVIKNNTLLHEKARFARAGYLDVETVIKIRDTQEMIREKVDQATDIVNECVNDTKQQITKTLHKVADMTNKVADKISKDTDNKNKWEYYKNKIDYSIVG